jgi:predicted transcriptional regulator of viral defense system
MKTKNTILSEKDSQIIQEIFLKFGRIVNSKDLLSVFEKEYSKASAHNRIQKLHKLGWFLRIKKGMYLIIDTINSRFMNDKSLFLVAKAIKGKSYISLHSALNYYQMFDQYSTSVAVVNCDISKKYNFANSVIRFIKISKKYYFGFSEIRYEGKVLNMASKEKALIDFLYLDSSFSSASLVFEKMKNHKNIIDFDLLQSMASKFGVSLQRKFGFFLDQLEIDSSFLFEKVSREKGFSKLTKDSKIFNAKWRLYYDDRDFK